MGYLKYQKEARICKVSNISRSPNCQTDSLLVWKVGNSSRPSHIFLTSNPHITTLMNDSVLLLGFLLTEVVHGGAYSQSGVNLRCLHFGSFGVDMFRIRLDRLSGCEAHRRSWRSWDMSVERFRFGPALPLT